MIILNEKKYVKECLITGDIGEQPRVTLKYIAALYYSEGKKPREVEDLLHDFSFKNNPSYCYNRSHWDEQIEKITKKAKKYTLKENDGVWITKAEMDRIAEIDDIESEKLLFTFLCLAKLRNLRNPDNNNWVSGYSYKDIFSLARVSKSTEERNRTVGWLASKGYFEFAKKNENLSDRVLYVFDDSEPVLHVTDFRELGYWYLRYRGENIIECAECGVLTRGNRWGNKIYCSNCVAPMPKMKIVECVDCGIKFEVSKNSRKVRCPDCKIAKRSEHDKKYYRRNSVKFAKEA